MSGDEDADKAGGEHGVYSLSAVPAHGIRGSKDGSGESATGAGCGGGDDHAHGAFHFHHGADVEDDPVEDITGNELAVFEFFFKTSGLTGKDAVFEFGAAEAGGDGVFEDCYEIFHALADFGDGDASTSGFVVSGELGEGEGASFLFAVSEHFFAREEGDGEVVFP